MKPVYSFKSERNLLFLLYGVKNYNFGAEENILPKSNVVRYMILNK
ncbi:MAG: hypothetical protein PVJ67_05410 [Candidatus Pacearchaeota archaeon]|jgi:hypothetical protein